MVTFVACEPASSGDAARTRNAAASPATSASGAATSALSIASWNLEWFGDPANGPGDEPLQLENARTIIESVGADVWAMVEIVDESQWRRLLRALPEYDGVLATDTRVPAGRRWYGASEQKLALLARKPVRILDARLILTDADGSFAGRPPLEVRLRVPDGAGTRELTVVVVHFKARDDEASWRRRRDGAERLKRYLDERHPQDAVLVAGDWNDAIGRSITAGRPSPFAELARDSAAYRFLTRAATERGESSTSGNGAMIDHHLATDELSAFAVASGATIVRPTVRQYRRTTSDHYPVVSRFDFSRAGR